MATENEQTRGVGSNEVEQAKAQVQFLLGRLGQLGSSAIQVRVDGGTDAENQVAEQFVEGCIVLMSRFGTALIQAAEDSTAFDVLEHHVASNPGVDLIVPEAVIESTLAADEAAPLRVIVAHLAAMEDEAAAAAASA